MSDQKPSIGRIVHFVLKDGERAGEHRAALMTSAFDGPNQNLTVFADQREDFGDLASPFEPLCHIWSAPYDEEAKGLGTWHWPERV